MRNRNMKRFLAVAMATTMVMGSSVMAFAEGPTTNVTGSGIVEYDDSVDIVIEKFEVPVITDATYAFTLDPTGLMHTYESDKYDAGTVYFDATKVFANVKAKVPENGDPVTLYTREMQVVAQDATPWKVNGTWSGLTTVDGTGALTAINGGLYVWTYDDTANSAYSGGKPGSAVALTAGNVTKWFDVASDGKLSLKPTYKNEEATEAAPTTVDKKPIDGNIYRYAYSAVPPAGITDSFADPLKSHIVFDDDDAATAITSSPNLFKYSGSESDPTDDHDPANFVAPDFSAIVYTPAETGKLTYSQDFTVVNKSTTAKEITATVTASNVGGIAFKGTNDFDNDETASMYLVVTDHAAANPKNAVLTKEDGDATKTTASAIFTANLAAKGGGAEVTYRTIEENTNTGGHKYLRYEGYGSTYPSTVFRVEGEANTNADDAWKTWAATVTSTARPSINVVYSVDTHLTDADKAAAFKTTYAAILGKTTSTVTAEDSDDIEAALTAYAALSAEVKALLTEEKTLLDDLKTAAEALADRAPSIATTTYSAAADTAIDITVDLGAGDLKATGIASVTYKNKSNVDVAVAADTGYTFANGKVTLTAATVNAFMSATATSREFTITFNDTANTAVTVTVNK